MLNDGVLVLIHQLASKEIINHQVAITPELLVEFLVMHNVLLLRKNIKWSLPASRPAAVYMSIKRGVTVVVLAVLFARMDVF
jgi:hypothetical protein